MKKRRCTFLPVLLGCKSPEGAEPIDTVGNSRKVDQHERGEFTETSKTPLTELVEGYQGRFRQWGRNGKPNTQHSVNAVNKTALFTPDSVVELTRR